MTKADLKTGMIITCANGSEYLVLRECDESINPYARESTLCVDVSNGAWIHFDSITDDLKDTMGDPNWEIVKVEVLHHWSGFTRPRTAGRDTVWERTPRKKYNHKQLEELLGHEFDIVED